MANSTRIDLSEFLVMLNEVHNTVDIYNEETRSGKDGFYIAVL